MIHYLVLPKNNKTNCWLLLEILRLENLACLERVCICLSFIFLCYEMGVSTNMLEKQVLKEIDLDLNVEKDIITDDSREENLRGVDKEGDNKKKIHDLRLEVYVK